MKEYAEVSVIVISSLLFLIVMFGVIMGLLVLWGVLPEGFWGFTTIPVIQPWNPHKIL